MSAGLPVRLVRLVARVLGGLLLFLGIAPYGFGLRAQMILSTLVEQLAEVWHVPVVTSEYQRGWFSSTAEMRLAVSPGLSDVWRTYVPSLAGPPGEAVTVSLTHRVLHGPLPFASATQQGGRLMPVQALLESTVRPGVAGNASVTASPETAPALHVTTTVFLNGASQSRVFMPAFVAPSGAASAALLIWNGLRGEVSLHQHGQQLRGAMRAPGLYLKRGRRQVSLHNAVLRFDARSELSQPLSGQFLVRLDTLEVGPEGKPQPEWAIAKGELRTAIAVAGETMQAEIDLQCATCRLAYMDSDQGMVHFEARRLSMPALLYLAQEVAVLWPDEPDIRSLWLRLLYSGELAHVLAAFARANPTLTLTQARLQTPEGEVLLTGHMQLEGGRMLVSEHLPLLLQRIDAEATLEAPVNWVKAVAVTWAVHLIRKHSTFASFLSLRALRLMAAIAVDKYLRNLVEQAYLMQEGPRYKSRVRYTKGQWLVNDKALELSALAP